MISDPFMPFFFFINGLRGLTDLVANIRVSTDTEKCKENRVSL